MIIRPLRIILGSGLVNRDHRSRPHNKEAEPPRFATCPELVKASAAHKAVRYGDPTARTLSWTHHSPRPPFLLTEYITRYFLPAGCVYMANEMIGRYELLEKRGEGGFGILYKAMDTMIERVVALKVLHTQHASNERLSAWFRREAKAMARLNHPNIVTIHNFEVVNDQHFIVMEYVEGNNLDEELSQHGPLSIDDAMKVLLQMVDGFGYAHENGIVHRDIKPSNIMIDASRKVKITDFGIAKILGDTKLTRTGTGAGSIPYMSPEQIEGKPIDARTDIYSLGITLYQMLTGSVPFTDESEFVVMRAHLDQVPTEPSALRPDIPPALETIVLRMLEKEPEGRYGSMKELSAELGRLSGPSVTEERTVDVKPVDRKTAPFAPPPPTGPVAYEPDMSGKSRLPLIIGALAVIVLLAVVSYIVFLGEDEVPSDWEVAVDSTEAVVAESVAVDSSGLEGQVASADTTPSEAVKPPAYEGKIIISVSPFDYRDRPVVVFAGKRITVDEIPFEITGVKNGWHRISVHYKDGSFFEDIFVDDNTQTKTYKFNGPKGRVSIGAEFIGQEAQPWAEVVIDDKPILNGTPTSVELVEGPHRILVRKDGYELVGNPKIVYAKARKPTVVNFKLRRK